MSVARKLVGQTAAYGLSTIIGRAITYLLVPIYTAIFAPAELGVQVVLYAYVAFFNILFTYGMETAYFRFANKPGADRQHLYNHVMSLLLVTSAVFTGLLLLFSDQIAELVGYPQYPEYVRWLAWVLGIDAVAAIAFARLRLENKAIRFATIRLFNIFLTVGANIFFLVICRNIYQGDYLQQLRPLIQYIYDPELGVGYIFLINLGANLLLLPFFWRQFTTFKFKIDKELLRPMLVYAYPLMFMGLAGMVNEVLDRILLKSYLPENFYQGLSNEAVVGIYGNCYKLAIFMSLAIQAFRYAAEPFFFSQAQEKNSPATFALIMKWFVIACAFIFLFISANLEDFALLLRRESYRQGIMVVPVLLMANLFLGVYYNLSVWFKLTDKTHYGTFISFGGAAVTILLNLLLIPVIGYFGAAFTTLACYFSMALASYVLGQKYFPVPYPVKTMAAYVLAAVALAAAALYVPVSDFWLRHAWHLLLCITFVAIIWIKERPSFPMLRKR
ncbi:MAG: polysaccharide biosynthesis C-terminal domain-containing protein [Hymenobacteraceae bacterium]|nr:polysaccharide biosynthesis C-terminal domain-containing protein [Hymenobacteraceae bacterium]MDX5396958.1 polysaccharide biosynthesis C-terminal domain-containing protein [Hymenobacteraceae bacterium]MDX5513032.1 polysaccharide biosynthesis C-terminal domain-containing protein [Hymenobacteraceae bacterium]